MSIRICAISDPHGLLPEVPECDILCLSGDVTPATNHAINFQIRWFGDQFSRWLDSVPASEVIWIAGNHDFALQEEREKVVRNIIADKSWIYLQDQSYETKGLKFFGCPWSLFFYDWAFNAPRHDGETFLAKIYEEMAPNTDVVLSHGPPWGGHPEFITDADHTNSYMGRPREHVGSKALLAKLQEVKPLLVVTGHIHGGYGVYPLDIDGKPTIVANSSVVNEQYIQVNSPLLFDIDIDGDGKKTIKQVIE